MLNTCSRAYENDSSQTLAVVLSIVFTVYVGSAILLSALQLYSITNTFTASNSKGGEVGTSLPLMDVSAR